MVYENGQTNLRITKDNDKEIITNVVNLFLEEKNMEEISEITGVSVEIIDIILRKRDWVVKVSSEEKWEKIKILLKQQSAKEKEKEYERLMDNIIALILNSLYTYEQIAEYSFITSAQLSDMLNNTEYIEKYYGKHILDKINETLQKRRNLPQERIDGSVIVLRAPEYRMIVKSDVIAVDSYTLNLINKVLLFLDYEGNTEQVAMNSEYAIKDIVASLNDVRLKDLLFEHVYEKVQNLLEIDSILTQNRIQERNKLIKTVIEIVLYEDGDLDKIEEDLKYPEHVIRRILSHPYVSIYCCKNNIEIPVLKRENEGQISEIKDNSYQKTL